MRLRGPIAALVWEQWRLVREAYFRAVLDSAAYLALFGLPVFLLIGWLRKDPIDPTEVPGFPRGGVFAGVFLFATHPLLRFAQSLVCPAEDGDDRRSCLTSHQWVLPVSRGGFVATYLLVRLALVVSLAVLFGGACSLLELTQGSTDGQTLDCFVMSLGLALPLAFVVDWLQIRASVSRRVRMSLAELLLAFPLAALLLRMCYGSIRNAGWYEAGSLALSAVFVVLAIGIALSFDRLAWLNRFPFSFDSVERLFRRRRRFQNGFMAQAWYEWRRHGVLGPGCYMGVLTAVLVPIVCWSSSETPHPVISPFLLGPSPNVANALSVLLLAVCGLSGRFLLFDEKWTDRRRQSFYPRLMPGVPGMLTPINMAIAAHMAVLPTLALGAWVMIGIATGWFRVEMLPVTLGDHTTLAWAASVLATSCGLLALMVALLVAGWLVCMLIPCLTFALISWAVIWLPLAYGVYWHEPPVAGNLFDLWTKVWIALPACALVLFIVVGAPSLVFARKPLSRNVFSATTMQSCFLLAFALICELALLFNGLPADQRLIPVGVALLVLLLLASLAITARTRRFPHPVVVLLLALLIAGAMILLRLNYPEPLRGLPVETVYGLPIVCCLPMPAVLFHVRWVGTHWYDEPKEA